MRSLAFKFGIPAILVVLLTGQTLSPAQAYATEGCRWTSTKIIWTNASSTLYKSTSTAAVAAWTSVLSVVSISAVPPEYSYNIRVFDVNNGATGIDGSTTFYCSGGYFTGITYASINSYYGDNYSADGKKQVLVHEFGHSLGLAHSGTSTCSGQPIMYYSSARYFTCNHVNPQADDITGINYIY
jgi:hypothetical protein